MRGLWLSLAGAVVLALACAAALDAMGATTVAFGLLGWCGAAALGAAQATMWPALLLDGRVSRRRAAVGGIVAGAAAFVLGRAPFGWLDLGAIGAGLPGELQLVVLPVVSALAVIAAWPIARATRASGAVG